MQQGEDAQQRLVRVGLPVVGVQARNRARALAVFAVLAAAAMAFQRRPLGSARLRRGRDGRTAVCLRTGGGDVPRPGRGGRGHGPGYAQRLPPPSQRALLTWEAFVLALLDLPALGTHAAPLLYAYPAFFVVMGAGVLLAAACGAVHAARLRR